MAGLLLIVVSAFLAYSFNGFANTVCGAGVLVSSGSPSGCFLYTALLWSSAVLLVLGVGLAILGAAREPSVPSPQRIAGPFASRRVRNMTVVVIVVVAALVLALAGLYTLPIPTAFSDQFTATGGVAGGATFSPPSGAQVHGGFSAANGGPLMDPVIFHIYGGGEVIYSSVGRAQGSFSFTATQPTYAFSAEGGYPNTTVYVSGYYVGPIL